LVSVVIPTFNRRAQLAEAIASVRSQTYPSWELIVADDGSSDGTPAYLREVGDERIRAHLLPHTGSPSVARNTALRDARGAYVAFLDSDDLWLPDKLTKQVDALHHAPSRRWSYTDYTRLSETGADVTHRLPSATPGTDRVLCALLRFEIAVAMPTVMVERSLAEEVAGFDESLRYCEDYEFFFRLALAGPVCVVPERLTVVRAHAPNRDPDHRLDAHRHWIRAYDKLRALTPDPVVGRLCRRQAAERWVRVARLQAGLGRAGPAATALRAALAYAAPSRAWWRAALSVAARLAVPHRVLRASGWQRASQ
jgi:glycosyltransferase involved in cell wall biosynthesis